MKRLGVYTNQLVSVDSCLHPVAGAAGTPNRSSSRPFPLPTLGGQQGVLKPCEGYNLSSVSWVCSGLTPPPMPETPLRLIPAHVEGTLELRRMNAPNFHKNTCESASLCSLFDLGIIGHYTTVARVRKVFNL